MKTADGKVVGYAVLGMLLVACFLIQDIFSLKWPWLVTMQTDETFKRVTGFLLIGYIFHQLSLSVGRFKGKISETSLTRHMAWGAFAPLVFYFHTHRIGYAYLFLLSIVYLLNVSIGFLNRAVVGINKKWYLVSWMVVGCRNTPFIPLGKFPDFGYYPKKPDAFFARYKECFFVPILPNRCDRLDGVRER